MASTFDRPLWLIAALGAAYAAAYLGVYFSETGLAVGSDPVLAFSDFWQFWAAGEMAPIHGAAAVYDLPSFEAFQRELLGGEGKIYPMPYPPPMLMLTIPISALPYGAAALSWLLGTLLLALVWLETGPDASPRAQRALLLFAPATLVNFVLGQNGFFSAACFIAGVRWMRRAPWLSGVAFGVLTLKFQLGLMIPFALLAAGAWRVVAGATATALGLAALSAVVFGPDVWLHYARLSSQISEIAMSSGPDSGFSNLQAGVLFQALSLGAPRGAAIGLQAVVSLAAIAGVIAVFRRRPDSRWAGPVLMTATFLGPWSSFYDMPTLAVAAIGAGLMMRGDGFRPGELLALVAVWTLPVVGISTTSVSAVWTPLVLIAFFALLLSRAWSEPSALKEPPLSDRVAGS